MVKDKILEIESEISALNDKICELNRQIKYKQKSIYTLYSEITSVEELADVLACQFVISKSDECVHYFAVFFCKAKEHTEPLGKMLINGCTVTVNVNPYYGYIDVVGLSEKDEALFRSVYPGECS